VLCLLLAALVPVIMVLSVSAKNVYVKMVAPVAAITVIAPAAMPREQR